LHANIGVERLRSRLVGRDLAEDEAARLICIVVEVSPKLPPKARKGVSAARTFLLASGQAQEDAAVVGPNRGSRGAKTHGLNGRVYFCTG
jgi:hypothetical protein